MTDHNGLETFDAVAKEASPDIETIALRRKIKALKAEIRGMEHIYGDLKAYFADLAAAAVDLKIPPLEPIHVSAKRSRKTKCSAVLHWSDWHYGAVQEPDEVEFMGKFSPDICERRVANLHVDYLKWIEVLRNGYQFDELVIIDTGDNISGDIHNELSITNAFPAPVQSVRVGQLKGLEICKLAQHFKNVRVEFICADNHGRLTKKPQSKQEGMNTFNYVVGFIAGLTSSQQSNVTFNMHPGYTRSIQVQNRRYLIAHGHNIIGWAGHPWYGIERMVGKEAMARLNEPDYKRFHRAVMGHFHTPVTHPWYWFGGSVSGTDAYDRKNGRNSVPIQCGWFVHPERGEMDRMEFQLRDD